MRFPARLGNNSDFHDLAAVANQEIEVVPIRTTLPTGKRVIQNNKKPWLGPFVDFLSYGILGSGRLGALQGAANAQDATAAFLLAQTYDPDVLGVRDTRSITPDPVMAREWYRKAASFGSADAQQRLTQLQN